jgi:hypothetical protein
MRKLSRKEAMLCTRRQTRREIRAIKRSQVVTS